MKKLLIFPYHPDIEVLIKHRDKLLGFQIIGVVSFKEDKHLIEVFNKAVGAKDKKYDDLVQLCDAILILDNYRKYSNNKYFDVLNDAVAYNKQIYVTPLAEWELTLRNTKFEYTLLENVCEISGYDIEYKFHKEQNTYQRLHEIEVPVVSVMGMGKHCGKFEMQILFQEALRHKYNVISVCSNALGALFGYYTIPSWMYQEIGFQDKIVLTNHYINRLIGINNPDVVLIGVPEGIAPCENIEANHYAEYALVITAALSIDFAIVTTYYVGTYYSAAALERMAKAISSRFLVSIKAIAISKTMFEVPEAVNESIAYELLDDEFLENKYPVIKGTEDLILIDMYRSEKCKEAIEKCIREIERNAIVV